MSGKLQFTVDLNADGVELLGNLAADRNCTKADVIQRALTAYRVLSAEVKAGRKVSITDANDRIVKEIIFY